MFLANKKDSTLEDAIAIVLLFDAAFHSPHFHQHEYPATAPLNFSRSQILKFKEPQVVLTLYSVEFLRSLNLPFL